MGSKRSILEKLKIVERTVDIGEEVIELEDCEQHTEVSQALLGNEEDDIMKANKLMDIRDIYKKTGLSCDGTNTIFIVDNFSKALPENLPTDVRRQSVLNLISASGMDVDNIFKDGKDRLQTLDMFLQNFSDISDEAVSKSDYEIKRLTEQINEHRKLINERRRLMKEQKAVIEYETQKIDSIMNFIDQTR